MLGNVVYKLQSSQLAFELTTLCAFIVLNPKKFEVSEIFMYFNLYLLFSSISSDSFQLQISSLRL